MKLMGVRVVPDSRKSGFLKVSDNAGPTFSVELNHPDALKPYSLEFSESELAELRDGITAVLRDRRRRLKSIVPSVTKE